MIPYLSAVFLAVGFIGVAKVCGLVPRARAAITTSKRTLEVVKSPNLDDEAKEAALQQHARELFAAFLFLTFGGAAAVGLPAAILWGLEQIHIGSVSAAIDVALSPAFLVPSSVLVLFALFWNRRES